ncbi:hypothetical protein niasHT_031253 [Heterodera trifolii]|uniref:Aldehyde dehydrogenase domain-containing protein n=1 Tax=Heterodera trifolii TaxID=157864 RepID=A0ABD2ID10_9BILA
MINFLRKISISFGFSTALRMTIWPVTNFTMCWRSFSKQTPTELNCTRRFENCWINSWTKTLEMTTTTTETTPAMEEPRAERVDAGRAVRRRGGRSKERQAVFLRRTETEEEAILRCVVKEQQHGQSDEQQLDEQQQQPRQKVRDPSIFMSAVIDAKAFKRISDYIAYAKGAGVKKDGTRLVFGGKCDDSRGWFIEPTCVEVDNITSLLKQEIFGPFVAVYVYNDEDAGQLVRSLKDQTPFGLTGAVFSQDKDFLYEAKDILRDAAGNLYLNDKCTGSFVGQQPFGGARQSGTNDKAGGPHYVLRWTSAQVIKESFGPLTEWRYPHID